MVVVSSAEGSEVATPPNTALVWEKPVEIVGALLDTTTVPFTDRSYAPQQLRWIKPKR
jgi:hypothetical protein